MGYSAFAGFGAVVIMLLYTNWENSFFILVAILSIAWLLIFIFALRNLENRPSVTPLLRSFRRKVDHACQQRKSGERLDDQRVLQAFDELNAEIKYLLERKTVGMARVKRELMSYLYSPKSQSFDWRPPSLSELGYLLDIRKRYSKDAPVLAIYQLTRESSDATGMMVGTYEIMRKDLSLTFPATITIGIHLPSQQIGVEPITAKIRSDTHEYRGVSRNSRTATN